MKTPIYLDNSATTPLDPAVVDAMLPFLREQFGNPASSTHAFGIAASRAVENARAEVATLVNAEPRDIAWTSGATESNNLAIKGAALAAQKRGKHILTVQTEHKAVLDTVKWLERQGFSATYLAPQKNGLVDAAEFRAALRPDTVLALVMLVNNEIGVIQDIAALGAICRDNGTLFHVDAAQATGKVAIDLATLPVDIMSLTAHKTYGPKGIGALYVRRLPQVRIECQMHGGGHERGLRSGTLATHQIVGMGAAFRIAGELMATEVPQLRALRDRFWNRIKDVPGVILNGDLGQRIANNLNISLDIANCDSLVTTLSDIAVSSTSACSTGGVSHVLQALGSDAGIAGNSIRISVGRFNTAEEIDWAADYLRGRIEDCRAGRLCAA
ncbi:MAG: aminotransferase class V-fold PLP-dependent enzyme [Betaproteobacteria bacterium]|nr:aminotransferase class V-fold PLP-dependent enzyme [Betaproteobacteria bacterium]